MVAFASSLDQIGPLTKTVEDSALVLQSIAGHDSRDSTSLDVKIPDYVSNLGTDLKGFRIGVPKEYFIDGIDLEIKKSVLKAIDVLEGLGALGHPGGTLVAHVALLCMFFLQPAAQEGGK